ncbi:MAG TPA: hypothetical protein VFV23_13665 [Verrucomicrobiae bacterium]|nr:hypothetical protein [Verrucomicrobiae bacterium]
MNRKFYADGTGKTCCVVCEKEIPDGNWFSRFPFGDGRIMTCSPPCMEKFLDSRGVYAAKLGLNFSAETAAK